MLEFSARISGAQPVLSTPLRPSPDDADRSRDDMADQQSTNIALCQCGCGQLAPIAWRTIASRGQVKGRPLAFIGRHKLRVQQRPLDLDMVCVGCGEPCRPLPYDGYAICASAHVNVNRFWRGQRVQRVKALSRRTGRFYDSIKLVVSQRPREEKTFCIHVLVLTAWVGPRPSADHQARHLDGNNRNNHLSNLAWGTHAENYADMVRHGTAPIGSRNASAKLSEEDVVEICRRIRTGVRTVEIAAAFNCSTSTIYMIRTGRRRRVR